MEHAENVLITAFQARKERFGSILAIGDVLLGAPRDWFGACGSDAARPANSSKPLTPNPPRWEAARA